jgi:hypothetical protein
MTEDPSHTAGPEDEASVFGNLPRTRPGARSPRRDEATSRRSAEPKSPDPEPESPPDPLSPELDAERILSESRPSEERSAAAEPPEDHEDGGGIEELAWAGVAAAAEAATLGVRLANRAMESLRGGSPEDRGGSEEDRGGSEEP